MNHRRYTPAHLLLSALAGAFAALLAAALAAWAILGSQCLSLVTAWGLIRSRFVEELDSNALADAALSGMVSALDDRWSHYYSAQRHTQLQQQRENAYVGVGITVDYSDDRGLTILAVTPGGPAAQGGVVPGELITAVDGTSLRGNNTAGPSLIQGEPGTTVTLALLSPDGGRRSLVLTRETMAVEPVSWELLEGGVGYVRLENFYDHSADKLNAAVDDLAARGATALLFDVRNNGGGYVTELTAMLDHLLPEGPVFRLEYKDGGERVSQSDAACVDLPMAVLVNRDTYSAAELFAAQLKETAGAVVVGETTSGKGHSQQTFTLPNGGGLNISTARYTTGGGVSLIGTGVALDAEIEMEEAQRTALAAGNLSKEEDLHLQKALALLAER